MLTRPLPCWTVRLTGGCAPVGPLAILARPGSCHRVRLQRVCRVSATLTGHSAVQMEAHGRPTEQAIDGDARSSGRPDGKSGEASRPRGRPQALRSGLTTRSGSPSSRRRTRRRVSGGARARRSPLIERVLGQAARSRTGIRCALVVALSRVDLEPRATRWANLSSVPGFPHSLAMSLVG